MWVRLSAHSHWCAGHWAHLAVLAAVGGALALGAEQQLVQQLATVLVVAEPGRVGAPGARCSSSILVFGMTASLQRMTARAAASPTQEAGLLSLCLAQEPASSLAPLSLRGESRQKQRESARSRLCKGKEGAHGISDCRQLACAAPLLRAQHHQHGASQTWGRLHCAPCPSSRLLAASRSWPARGFQPFRREHS